MQSILKRKDTQQNEQSRKSQSQGDSDVDYKQRLQSSYYICDPWSKENIDFGKKV